MVTDVIDLADPYSAAAMYNGFLICEGCPDEPALEAPTRYNLAHYHRLGQVAKAKGWFVAPVKGDEVSFTVYCPTCARGRGLVPDPDQRFVPSEALLTVADLASGPSNDVTPNTSLERTRDR